MRRFLLAGLAACALAAQAAGLSESVMKVPGVNGLEQAYIDVTVFRPEGAGPGIDVWSLRQPVGVAAGITPFNFPAMIPLWMLGPAVATGNAFNIMACTSVKIAVLAPMPKASVSTAVSVKPGALRSCRTAYRKS